jgi:biopolymer transport protein ExbB
MKLLWIIIMLAVSAGPAFGEDLRAVSRKAKADMEAARTEARAREMQILESREQLTAALSSAEARVGRLKVRIADAQHRLEALKATVDARHRQQSEDRMDLREYTGVVREAARDLAAILNQSHFTALDPGRLARLDPLLAADRFPGLEEISILGDGFFQEMALAGEVDLRRSSFIAADGAEAEGGILTLGGLCAIYQRDGETGYLRYNEANQRLYALARRPPWTIRRNLNRYIEGRANTVVFDFSKGAALRQLSHRASLTDKIKQGGPVVWPILGIGLLALLIAIERTLYLNRVHANTDRLMGRVNQLAGAGDWAGCENVLAPEEGKPVCNVLRAGLGAVNEKRETLESVLQEALLKELPRLERFLPALNIMGAVAPLMGLLGTVTGMIETFQAITLYGAGDPRMMSGGISEALITTMLGLAVAIPIMLVHTFLRRRLEHIVGDMEEKAVAMSNIICRECSLVSLEQAPAVSATAAR